MAKYEYEDVLEAFGIDLQDYTYKFEAPAGPDKFFVFFGHKDGSKNILALLVEDYVESLQYVKDCFKNDLNVELIELHKTKQDNLHEIEVPPHYRGFLATVRPKMKNRDFFGTIRSKLRPRHRWEHKY